jgi:hypothetical protein
MDQSVGEAIQGCLPAAPTGSRAPEIGGVLLGRVQEFSEGHWSVQIHNVELLDCERAWDESYTLTLYDKAQWSRRLRQLLRERKNGYVPVGWFRTHTRKGLYMDQHDLELMRLFFPHPSSVAMIVRPGRSFESGTAGFFLWENGDMERAQPQEAFAFPPQGVGADAESSAEVAAAPEIDLPPLVGPVRQPRRAWLWATAAAGALAGILWQPADTGVEPPNRVLIVVDEAADVAPVLPSFPTAPVLVNGETEVQNSEDTAPEAAPVTPEKEPKVVARRHRGVPVNRLDTLRPAPAPAPKAAAPQRGAA